jgi:hypothetical protein
LKKILFDYCRSDVNLLARVLIKYFQGMKELTSSNPLIHCTLPGFSFYVWKAVTYRDERLYQHARVYPLPLDQYNFVVQAYRGGKTEVFRTYYRCQGNERIGDFDFNSMYPACMTELLFPVGDPVWVNNPPINFYDFINSPPFPGFLKVDIDVTGKMLYPLLPNPKGGDIQKLIFPCEHLRDLVITGLELKEALTHPAYQYRLVKIHQALRYPKTHALFPNIMTWYKERLVAKTNGDTTKSNLLKLLMNSLYGKFGEQPDKKTRKIVKSSETEPKKIDEFCQSRLKNHRMTRKMLLHEVDEEDEQVTQIYMVEGTPNEEQLEANLCSKNVAIPAYITAQGRIRLNRLFNHFGDRVLYGDTDSAKIIYEAEHPPDMMSLFPEFNVGDDLGPSKTLGALKDELDGGYITEFVSLAPKTYAYSMVTREGHVKQELKMKGFSQNYLVDQQMSVGAMKDLVMNPGMYYDLKQRTIYKSKRALGKMESKIFDKRLQFKMDELKGEYIKNEFRVVPFGYNKI